MFFLAAAPSKVPFYIAGGALAAWAVLVSFWGVRHTDFPSTRGAARLVMLTSFVLVVTTMAMAVLTAGEATEENSAEARPAAPGASGRTFAVAADPTGALKYDKTRAAVLNGRVTVEFTNASTVDHNVTIAQGSTTLRATRTFSRGEQKIDVQLAPGDYVFYCSVAGHRQAGMQGTLTVQ